MYKKNNKTCYTCGKVYTYCPSCSEFSHLPKWMNMWHDENCMNIWNIVCDHETKLISTAEAASRLAECNLSIEIKNDTLKKQIDNIMGTVNIEKSTEKTESVSELVNEEELKSVNVSGVKSKVVKQNSSKNAKTTQTGNK